MIRDMKRLKEKRWVAAVTLVAATALPTHGAAEGELATYNAVRVAFYERAPTALASSMSTAVKRNCRETTASVTRPEWLCTGKGLVYLRAVNVLGSALKVGFACDSEGVTPNLRYFTEDMLTSNENCVVVTFDASTGKHSVDTSAR